MWYATDESDFRHNQYSMMSRAKSTKWSEGVSNKDRLVIGELILGWWIKAAEYLHCPVKDLPELMRNSAGFKLMGSTLPDDDRLLGCVARTLNVDRPKKGEFRQMKEFMHLCNCRVMALGQAMMEGPDRRSMMVYENRLTREEVQRHLDPPSSIDGLEEPHITLSPGVVPSM